MSAPRPQWKRGPRCHEYWLRRRIIGYISVPRRRALGGGETDYGWEYTGGRSYETGRARTLKAAKRAVEAEYLKASQGAESLGTPAEGNPCE